MYFFNINILCPKKTNYGWKIEKRKWKLIMFLFYINKFDRWIWCVLLIRWRVHHIPKRQHLGCSQLKSPKHDLNFVFDDVGCYLPMRERRMKRQPPTAPSRPVMLPAVFLLQLAKAQRHFSCLPRELHVEPTSSRTNRIPHFVLLICTF